MLFQSFHSLVITETSEAKSQMLAANSKPALSGHSTELSIPPLQVESMDVDQQEEEEEAMLEANSPSARKAEALIGSAGAQTVTSPFIHFQVSVMGGSEHSVNIPRDQIQRISELRLHVANVLGREPAKVKLVFGTQLLFGDQLIDEMLCDVFGQAARVEITAVVAASGAMEDLLDPNDPLAQYMPDIFRKMKDAEGLGVAPGPMQAPQGDHCQSRMILVDWLVDVHGRYGLRPQTFFIAVNMIDGYLGQKHLPMARLKLLGVTCLSLAAKMEEVYAPCLKDFENACDGAYTWHDIRDFEPEVMITLGFKLVCPTALEFLTFFQMANDRSMDQCNLSDVLPQYILWSSLGNSQVACNSPSHLAAAAVALSNRFLQRNPVWPTAMCSYTGYESKTLEPCMLSMRDMVTKRCGLEAVRKKFASIASAVEKMC